MKVRLELEKVREFQPQNEVSLKKTSFVLEAPGRNERGSIFITNRKYFTPTS